MVARKRGKNPKIGRKLTNWNCHNFFTFIAIRKRKTVLSLSQWDLCRYEHFRVIKWLKKITWGCYTEIFLPVKFCWIQWFQSRSQHKLSEDNEVRREATKYEKHPKIRRGPKGHISCIWVQFATFLIDQLGQQFLFTHRPENTNLVEDVEILLPVKFLCIPFSGFRGEVNKMTQPIRGHSGHLFLRFAWKTQTW